MILAVDGGIATSGWAIVTPITGAIVELGAVLLPPIAGVDETTDRAMRAAIQATQLRAVAQRYERAGTPIAAIAGEAVSLGGPPKARLAMATALNLCWGNLVMLAITRGVDLLEVRPKLWQHAVQGHSDAVDYEAIERAVVAHIQGMPGHELSLEQLLAIPQKQRNHPLDACCVGMFAARRRHECARIVEDGKVVEVLQRPKKRRKAAA